MLSERERYRRLTADTLRMLIDHGEQVDDDPIVATLRDALDAVDPAPDDSGIRWPEDPQAAVPDWRQTDR